MQALRDAIVGGADGAALAGLPVPASYRATVLLRDEIEIAQVLIEQCAALSDADLVACARDAGSEHRRVMAARRGLSEIVCETLVGFGEPEVIETLLRNSTARLSQAGIETVVALSRTHPGLCGGLLKRPELRPSGAYVMFWWADAEARRLLEDAGETVDLQISPQKIRMELNGAALTSKVIDGAFPDYLRVIPRGNDKQADIDNALFAKAVDRVATISAEKSRSVKLAFDNDRVKLTVRNMEAGQAEEEVEIGYSDEPFEIGFNARYLLDVAGQITGENAAFRFADPASPTLVLDPGDPGVQYVLMPLRV